LYELTLAKVRELLREPEALFWIFVFPVLLALALGVAFRSQGQEAIPVAVQQAAGSDWIAEALDSSAELRAEVLASGPAREALRSGKVALVVIPGDPWTYWFDPTRPESRLARLSVDHALQSAAGRSNVHASTAREMTERGSRYIDFLIPGLLGMNLMGTGMWGIGFYVVNARSRHLLKRLLATPMRKSHYLLSQITGRLIFLIPEVALLVLFAAWAFEVPVRGSLLGLAVVCALGAMTFSGLGMSGTFFSTARFPDWMQPAVQALPLTAINDALRSVMIDGATLFEVGGEIAIGGAWCVGSFVCALFVFRWS
jgi:ABC-type multidrug transport system permease subunit